MFDRIFRDIFRNAGTSWGVGERLGTHLVEKGKGSGSAKVVDAKGSEVTPLKRNGLPEMIDSRRYSGVKEGIKEELRGLGSDEIKKRRDSWFNDIEIERNRNSDESVWEDHEGRRAFRFIVANEKEDEKEARKQNRYTCKTYKEKILPRMGLKIEYHTLGIETLINNAIRTGRHISREQVDEIFQEVKRMLTMRDKVVEELLEEKQETVELTDLELELFLE